MAKSFHFWQSFFSAPSAPLRDFSVWRIKQASRREAEGAERGQRNKNTLSRFARNSWMEDLYLPSVFSVLPYVKVIHLREDFDRGMTDRGIMARHCLRPIPLSIIPLSMAFPGMWGMRNRQRNVRQGNNSKHGLFSIPLPNIPLPIPLSPSRLHQVQSCFGCGCRAVPLR